MHTKLRKIQTILLIAFILIALPICLTKTASSSLFTCSSNLKLEYDAEITSQKIVPLNGEATVEINVGYMIGGRFAKWTVKYLSRKVGCASVDLSIKEKPSYCSA